MVLFFFSSHARKPSQLYFGRVIGPFGSRRIEFLCINGKIGFHIELLKSQGVKDIGGRDVKMVLTFLEFNLFGGDCYIFISPVVYFALKGGFPSNQTWK